MFVGYSYVTQDIVVCATVQYSGLGRGCTIYSPASKLCMWLKTMSLALSSSYLVFVGSKQHLQPLDTFSGLLIRPKCICGRVSLLNLTGIQWFTA